MPFGEQVLLFATPSLDPCQKGEALRDNETNTKKEAKASDGERGTLWHPVLFPLFKNFLFIWLCRILLKHARSSIFIAACKLLVAHVGSSSLARDQT